MTAVASSHMSDARLISRGYPLRLVEEEDGSWTVVAPDLPGMVAASRSVTAAMRLVPEAIDAWLERAVDDGLPIPAPSREQDEYSGRFVLRIAKGLHRRLANAAELQGVSLNSYCSTLLASALELETMRSSLARAMEATINRAPMSDFPVFVANMETRGAAVVAHSRAQIHRLSGGMTIYDDVLSNLEGQGPEHEVEEHSNEYALSR